MRSLKPLLVLGAIAVALVVTCLLLFEDKAAGVPQPGVAETLPAPAAPSRAAVGGTEPGAPRAAAAPAGRAPDPASRDDALRDRERTIAGRVFDARGEPVENATVYVAATERSTGVPLENLDPAHLSWARRADAATDASGRFRIALISGGNLRLGVRAKGYAPHDLSISSVESVHDVGDVVLDESVVLSGRVLDSARRPVAGAFLRRLDAGAGSAVILGSGPGDVIATTDEDGAFRLDELGSGPWMLLIRAERHPDKLERGETSRPGQVVHGLEFVLADGAEIRGRVVRAPPEALRDLWVRAVPVRPTGTDPVYAGALVDEAALLVVPRSARCAPDGSFAVTGLTRDAAYRLSGRNGEHDLLGIARTTWADALGGSGNVELVYVPPTSIAFQAVDAVTSEPVSELEVSLDGRPITPQRGNDGRMQILVGGAQESPLELRIQAIGFEALRRVDLRPTPGEVLDLGVLRLERAPTITVLVLDDASGKPVADAEVSLLEGPSIGFRYRTEGPHAVDDSKSVLGRPEELARTDSDGRARLRGWRGKQSTLIVRQAQFAPFSRIVLPETGDHEETVRLRGGGTVIVEARSPLGAPVPGVAIRHELAPGRGAYETPGGLETDELGQVTFRHLQAGKHTFHAGSGSRAGDIEVGEGTENVLVLTVERGRLAGRVTEGGQPLSGATIHLGLREVEHDPRVARTNGRGEFTFYSLELGSYDASIVHPARAMAFECVVQLTAPQGTFDVDLPITTIEGRLVGEDGRPLAGLRVRSERVGVGGDVLAATPGDARVISGADGSFVLHGVQSDVDLIVRSESADHQPVKSEVVRLAAGETRTGLVLELVAGATLEVTVAHADGRPASARRVSAVPTEAGSNREVTTDFRGAARFRGLRPGTWRIRVETEGAAPGGAATAEQLVEVHRGAVNAARFELR